jgi:hypothetical protein
MALPSFKDDTNQVRQEFDGLSQSTQIFIAVLVALGVLLGLLLGGLIGYGISVDEIEGRSCIEYEDTLYCADEEGAG